ncbi:MAG: aromatic ring-hydroxylating oxygenase subunit alpha [Thiolinea sp.]
MTEQVIQAEAGELSGFYAQLQHVVPPVAESASLPGVSYSSAAVLEREKQAIFRQSWICLGRADQWTESGQYSSRQIVDIPVIICRDEKLQLRVYVNSCRHRGARLLEEGQGSCKTFRCPFHRWTYQLNGQLLLAPKFPRQGEAGALNKSDYGLLELPVAEQAGFAFVALSEDVPPLAEWLGDFPVLHAAWSFDRLQTYRRHEFVVNCNWKAFLDVFNEYYHLPYVHPNSLDDFYNAPEPADEVKGQYATQFGFTAGNPSLLEETQQHALPVMPGMPERESRGTRYSWVFPNLTFAANRDAVWIYEALPLTTQTSQVALTLCFAPESFATADFEQRAEHYFERLITAIEEDIPALENQQAGLNAPVSNQGRYHALLEPNVAGFAFWYARMMAAATA